VKPMRCGFEVKSKNAFLTTINQNSGFLKNLLFLYSPNILGHFSM
jgi:hypothetical protein